MSCQQVEVDLPDPQMESILSGELDEVLVGANTGSLESLFGIRSLVGAQEVYDGLAETHLGGQLFVLVGNQVDAQREVVDTGTLASKIEDLNLGVGNTTVEPRLGVGLVCSSRKSSSAPELQPNPPCAVSQLSLSLFFARSPLPQLSISSPLSSSSKIAGLSARGRKKTEGNVLLQ